MCIKSRMLFMHSTKNQQWICCIGTQEKLLYTFLQKVLKSCSIRCNLEIWKEYPWDVCLLMALYHRMDHRSLQYQYHELQVPQVKWAASPQSTLAWCAIFNRMDAYGKESIQKILHNDPKGYQPTKKKLRQLDRFLRLLLEVFNLI